MEEQNNQYFEPQYTPQPEPSVENIPTKPKRSKLPLILIPLIVVSVAVTAFLFGSNIFGDSPLNHEHTLKETIIEEATSTKTGKKKISCTSCSYSKTEDYALEPLTAEEIYTIAEHTVGEVITYKKDGSTLSLGTAFVYSSDGKLITNYHVIEGAYSAKITLNKITYSVTKIVAYDKDIDIAILQIDKTGLKPATIQTENITGGSTVYAVGSAEGYTLSFSTGVVASPSRFIEGVEYVQHEAAISNGSSGGPLFNTFGEIIGINTLSYITGQNLNFAISCNELENLNLNSPLSFAQYYEKECNPFTLAKNYAIKNGTYDAADNEYSYMFYKDYSSDYTTTYYFYVDYDATKNVVTFTLFDDASSDYMVSFDVTESLSGYYEWSYIDSNSNYMAGTITAKTYTSSSALGYSSNNISSSSVRTAIRNLASSMVSYLLSTTDIVFNSELGLTVSDFGFTSY